MKSVFFVIGAPGSGKTSNAQIVADKFDSFTHYSTGEMLREEISSQSELGKEIASYINNGKLVPTQHVINTVINAINNAPTPNVIIDGFPRSVEQMEVFETLSKDKLDLKSVIEIRVSEDTAKSRILGRASEAKESGNVRADDNETVFYERMRVYLEPIDAIEKFYTQKGVYKIIDGEKSLEEVSASVCEFIESFK